MTYRGGDSNATVVSTKHCENSRMLIDRLDTSGKRCLPSTRLFPRRESHHIWLSLRQRPKGIFLWWRRLPRVRTTTWRVPASQPRQLQVYRGSRCHLLHINDPCRFQSLFYDTLKNLVKQSESVCETFTNMLKYSFHLYETIIPRVLLFTSRNKHDKIKLKNKLVNTSI